MSFFTDFVKNINSAIGRPTVNEKAAIVESRIVDYLKPSIENFLTVQAFESDFYRQNILTDRAFSKLSAELGRKSRSKRVDYINALAYISQNCLVILGQIQEKGTNILPETIVKEGITVPAATVLKLISSIDLFVEYSSRMLYHLAQHESKIEYKPTVADTKFLDSYKGSYIDICFLLSDNPNKIVADILVLEPVLVDDSVSIKASKEVVRLNFIPLVTPVFKRIGIAMVNWDIEREERLRLEKRGIESAIERYRQANSGNFDARSEQVIENWRKELRIVNQKIDSMER